MQTVHRLKRYNRQSRLRHLNSAIHIFLCSEWEAILPEYSSDINKQTLHFIYFLCSFSQGGGRTRGWQLNAECCLFSSFVFQGFI